MSISTTEKLNEILKFKALQRNNLSLRMKLMII